MEIMIIYSIEYSNENMKSSVIGNKYGDFFKKK